MFRFKLKGRQQHHQVSQLRPLEIPAAGSPGTEGGINSSQKDAHIIVGPRKIMETKTCFARNICSFIARPHCHGKDAEHQRQASSRGAVGPFAIERVHPLDSFHPKET